MKRVYDSGAQKRAKKRKFEEAAKVKSRTLFQCRMWQNVSASNIIPHAEVVDASASDVSSVESSNSLSSGIVTAEISDGVNLAENNVVSESLSTVSIVRDSSSTTTSSDNDSTCSSSQSSISLGCSSTSASSTSEKTSGSSIDEEGMCLFDF
jgi:hypothetical protein